MDRITIVFRAVCILGCLQLLVMGVSASDTIYRNNATHIADSGQIPDIVSSTSGATPRHPASPVKLIFIHHSTGQNWLADDNGGLGIALRNNNYFVSDTNYGWGPEGDTIGDRTDIGNWYDWFRGPNSPTYLADLYNESGQWSSYSRLASDPGGPNRIIMFKSCFPNSALQGNPADPVPPISSNPLRSQSAGSEYHTVANAKGIYIDLLNYFKTKQDTLFVVIAAPPLVDSTYSKNARVFNQWLVNDWLKNYPYKNVYVFDFYNVLTTNGGSPSVNDLGATGGNHHRWWNGAVQHQVNMAHNTSAYPSGDDHPSQAGNLKATGEYVPLLNYAYNQWTASISTSKIGVQRYGSTWMLDYNGNGIWNGAPADRKYTYGLADKYAVTGDWNSNGKSEIAIFRNGNGGNWFLDYNGNGQWDGTATDRNFTFGQTGDIPVAGNWNGGTKSEIGIFRGNGIWQLDYNGNGIWNAATDRQYTFGQTGDIPVAGNWNGDTKSEIGIFRNGTWQLDYNGNGIWNAATDRQYTFGQAGDIPVAGNWNGDTKSEIGIFRNGTWQLDYNGDGIWNATTDRQYTFGQAGDIPVTGNWN